MRRFRFYNIKWDTEGNCPVRLGLPTEMIHSTDDSEFDPELEGADLISDEHGFCVFGFEYQQLK